MIINKDCLEALKELLDNSIDCIVTDPPAGISFMGKSWDDDKGGRDNWIAWMQEIATECHRVLKPGGHGLVWSIPRTSHWTAMAWENAGFEIRDNISHVFGSGFPKSLNIGKSVDKINGEIGRLKKFVGWMRTTGLKPKQVDGLLKQKGMISPSSKFAIHYFNDGQPAIPTPRMWEVIRPICGEIPKWVDELVERISREREVLETKTSLALPISQELDGWGEKKEFNITKGTSEWEGWGTALKPAREDWWLIRKPIEKGLSIAENCLRWGVGGINIEKTRVPIHDDELRPKKIPAGEVFCSGFCDKYGFCPNSFYEISSFSRQQFRDYWQHIFSVLGSNNNYDINLLRDLTSVDYKNCKELLGVPYDYGLVVPRVNEYVRGGLQSASFLSDYPTLSHFCDEYVHYLTTGDLSISLLNNDVLADIVRFLDSQENIQLSDNILPLYFFLVCFAYSFVDILHSNYTTCKLKQQGRFPSNFIHDGSEEVLELFPNESHRFFYCAKASKSERNMGCEDMEEKRVNYMAKANGTGEASMDNFSSVSKNFHPTVKPIKLMEYLVNLVSKEGHTVLDPFAGSGTTGIACKKLNRNFIGIERDEEYCKIAEARINAV